MWSTRELAELAGTTLKAVRHYHRIGLLDEPERAANGYKKYRTPHLLRLLHITRLRDLGVPLKQIGAPDQLPDVLRTTDAELRGAIERLQHIRAELAVILQHRSPPDAPPAFAALAARLLPRDQDVLAVVSRLWEDQPLDDLRTLVSQQRDFEQPFESLPEDADPTTIEAVAARMAAAIREDHARFPWMRDPGAVSPRGARTAESVLAQVLAEAFNTAQLRVLARASELAGADAPADSPSAPCRSS